MFTWNTWRRTLLVLAVCALPACGTMTRMELETGDEAAWRYALNDDLAIEVDSLAQPLVDEGHTPGILVGVLLPDGETRFFGYGTIEQGTTIPPDADTQFPLGSLSKGFLGAMVAMLVEEGVFAWDDTLDILLPDHIAMSEDAKRITLLQLATHTSGLPRQPMTFQTMRYFLGYLFTGRSFYRHFDKTYILDYLAGFNAPAATEIQYSNIGYGLLGHIVELHSGRSLEALLQAKVIEPFGLRNTGYHPEQLPGFAKRARGHAGDQPKFIRRGRPVPDWTFTEVMKGSAAIHSTARDMLVFAATHLGNNGSPPPSALADTLVVRHPRPREGAAVAWLVDELGEQEITYQIGVVAGYTSYIGLDVARQTAVVVFQNCFTWQNDVGHNLLIRMARAEALKKDANPSGSETVARSK